MEQYQPKRSRSYKVGLAIKTIHALLEVIAGILFYFVSTSTITRLIVYIANGELLENSDNPVSQFLLHAAQQLSIASKFFIVSYLLGHGIFKLILFFGLIKRKSWSYKAAYAGMSILLLYQFYSLVVHYSFFLLVLTIIDLIIVLMVIREQRSTLKK